MYLLTTTTDKKIIKVASSCLVRDNSKEAQVQGTTGDPELDNEDDEVRRQAIEGKVKGN